MPLNAQLPLYEEVVYQLKEEHIENGETFSA